MSKIFVFGSNREGKHWGGAARDAVNQYGAVMGQPEGLQGSSYAIVTKELRSFMPAVTLPEVRVGVREFLAFARAHPELTFFLTAIGCGLAGFTVQEIAPLFRDAPANVEMPQVFVDELGKAVPS